MEAQRQMQMQTPGDNTARRSRNQHACQYCRSLKARCLPSDQAGSCQRCLASKRECVTPESQPRPKRARTSTSRVAQMEQKLDGLVALLAQPENGRPSSVTGGSPYSGQQPVYVDQRNILSPQSVDGSRRQFAGDYENSFPSADSHKSATPNSNIEQESYHAETPNMPEVRQKGSASQAPVAYGDDVNSSFANGLINDVESEILLNEFRSMSDFFPFAAIPSSTTALEMRKEKPILLLAILMTASCKNRPLQSALERKFRQELANRVIIQAQKSLEFLQSILVYLAWYHFHFHPRTQQLGMLLQLGVGMAIDLGISQKRKKPLIDISGQYGSRPINVGKEREAQRAFLGCYYLSTAFAVALSGPNLLKYTDYMMECCNRLKDDAEFVSDSLIVHMISLHHIGDQIHDTFRSEDNDVLPVSENRLHMHLQLLQEELKRWESRIPGDLYHGVLRDISYDFVNMELQSIGLRMTPGPSVSPNVSGAAASSNYVDLLLSCLEYGKSYLEKLLSMPTTQYRQLSFIQWMRLPYVLVIISKLSFSNPMHAAIHWDVRTAQERVRLDLYIDSLCYRMQSITTSGSPPQSNPDFFLSLKMILERTRGWYVRKTRSSAAAAGEGEANEVSPLEVIRDPHEDGQNAVATTNDEDDNPYRHPQPTAAPVDSAPFLANAPPPSSDLDNMDGFFENIDDSFWTSDFFNTGLGFDPSEMGL